MREFDELEIRAALDRAADLGYQDDLECARQLARVRVERRLEGPARLQATLTRRGSDPEIARRVVDEHFSDGEHRWLEAAASKWLGRNDWDRDRLARHLSRKGFSTSAILDALARLRPASGESSRALGLEDGG